MPPARTRALVGALIAALALTASAGGAAAGAAAPPSLTDARVRLTHLAPADAPTAMATRPGDTALFVTEQGGRVLVIRNGKLAARPLVDLTDRVLAGGEQGLLGIAFSPDGTRLDLHYSAHDGATKVIEYGVQTAAGRTVVEPASRRTLLTLAQPQPNHNGGQLAYGPDGALYLGLGDGGNANDEGPGHAPEGNAQSRRTLLGKIVRFDPKTRRPAIFALGLRNPWRFSFDRANDDLWIADVGQNLWEEIDHVPFASARGANFGWPLLEGSHPFRQDSAPGTIAPVAELSHDDGACAVIGGFVYRGTRIPALEGAYLYSDNCDGTIRALTVDAQGDVSANRSLGVHATNPTSFGQDAAGELYVLSGTEGVFRIDPANG
jgi:glucose/arabinose dehydrogenase